MDQMGTKQKLSISYYPQTNSQIERINQTIEQYLRYYLNYEQDNWVKLLPMAQFTFNNSTSVTRISPFYTNFGKYPNIIKEPKRLKPIVEKANVSVNRMKELHNMMQHKLEFISEKMAKHTNKKRSKGLDL